MQWMLNSDIVSKIDNAVKDGVALTASQLSAIAYGGEMVVAGDKAEIAIRGVLTPAPDFIAAFFGGGNTVYGDIIQAVRAADADPEVSEIILSIDSPGGTLNGMYETMEAIAGTDTAITAVVEGLAASAAYGLASQADSIVATNKMSRVGSVGVAAQVVVDENVVDIANSESPDKRPDVTTPEGKAVIREQLDAFYGVFAEAIANGRGKSIDFVNTNFGKGATLVAEDAMDRGMIDSINAINSENGPVDAQAVESTQLMEDSKMNLAQLKAEHPDVYKAAVDEGIAAENDRVSAHLTLGKASGDMDTAIAAVENGDELTAKLQAKYMAAGMNRKDIEARADDDTGADAGTPEAPKAASEMDTLAEETMSLIEKRMGVENGD